MVRFHFAPVLLAIAASVHAVDLARVCQATDNPYAPHLDDCRGFQNAVSQKYGNGLIIQTDLYASCQIVYAYSSCKVAICAFPGQAINATDFVTATNDLLNNCQQPISGTRITLTGGYEILKGTNATIGVFGGGVLTPKNMRCTTTASTSPLSNDCINAWQAINPSANVTQTDSSGCSVFATNGTCSFSYCSAKGSQMTGAEIKDYLLSLFFSCDSNKQMEGYVQVTSRTRINMFSLNAPKLVTNTAPVCRNYTSLSGKPSVSDCSNAMTGIIRSNPYAVVQGQKNSMCTPLGSYGNCQIDFCGPTGTTISSNNLQGAMKQINNTCISTGQGGYYQLAGSNATLSVTTTSIAKQLFCNPSPNNSPTTTDCGKLYNGIDVSRIYQQTSLSEGCTLVSRNGTCKLNYCAPAGDVISGAELKDAALYLLFGCNSGSYVSGIYQMSPTTSVGMYDPPDPIPDLWGNVTCTNNGDHPDYSPLLTDCVDAANMLLNGSITHCENYAKNPDDASVCSTIARSGTCGIAMCQATREMGCFYAGLMALEEIRGCIVKDGSGNQRVSAGEGWRNSGLGNEQLKIFNIALQSGGAGRKRSDSLDTLELEGMFSSSSQLDNGNVSLWHGLESLEQYDKLPLHKRQDLQPIPNTNFYFARAYMGGGRIPATRDQLVNLATGFATQVAGPAAATLTFRYAEPWYPFQSIALLAHALPYTPYTLGNVFDQNSASQVAAWIVGQVIINHSVDVLAGILYTDDRTLSPSGRIIPIALIIYFPIFWP